MIQNIRKKWDSWWALPNDHKISDAEMLAISGNQLHVFMLGLIFFLCSVFVVTSILLGTPLEALVTAIPIPILIFNYYGLYRRGYKIASKLLAALVTLTVVTLLTMMNGTSNGDLIYLIPIIVGILIIFQGAERKYAVIMVGFCLFIAGYLLITNRRIVLLHPYQHKEKHVEDILNYIGATLATIFQVGFLIVVNKRLQENTAKATHKLRFINDALSSAIKNNERQTKQISTQLAEIRKADLELKKLSMIATKTANGVIITDGEGNIEWVNSAFEKISGYSLKEVLGKKPKEFLLHGENSPATQLISEKLRSKEFVETTVLNYTKDNKPYYNHLEITPIFDEKGELINFIALHRDISEEINYLNEIERLKNNYEQVVAEVTNDYIWEWDMKGDKLVLGRGLDDIFDKVKDGETSHYIWRLENLHPDDREKLLEFRKQVQPLPGSKLQMEYRYMDKRGEYRIFFDRAFIRYDEKGKAINVIGAISDITDKKKMEEELIEQRLKEQKLIAQIAMQSQEKEKNKIAAELHENINQILAASKMYLDLYKSEHNTSDKFLNKSQEGIDKALDEIRKISHALAAPFSNDYDLMDAIHELLDQHLAGDPISIRVINELPKELVIPEDIKLVIYRILQEQVQNIHTYAEANAMEIIFRVNDNLIELTVADDGKGFDIERTHTGLGLKTINSRVTLHSGKMKLVSAPGKGCRLEVSLPLSKQGNLF